MHSTNSSSKMADVVVAAAEAPIAKQPSKKKVRIEASKQQAEQMFKFLEEKLPDLTEGNAQKDLPPPVKIPRKRKPAKAKEEEVVIVKVEEVAPPPVAIEEIEPIEPEQSSKRPRRLAIKHDKMIELIHYETLKQDPYYRVKIGAGCAILAGIAGFAYAPHLNALRYV